MCCVFIKMFFLILKLGLLLDNYVVVLLTLCYVESFLFTSRIDRCFKW
jgi:hypothetical protein